MPALIQHRPYPPPNSKRGGGPIRRAPSACFDPPSRPIYPRYSPSVSTMRNLSHRSEVTRCLRESASAAIYSLPRSCIFRSEAIASSVSDGRAVPVDGVRDLHHQDWQAGGSPRRTVVIHREFYRTSTLALDTLFVYEQEREDTQTQQHAPVHGHDVDADVLIGGAGGYNFAVRPFRSGPAPGDVPLLDVRTDGCGEVLRLGFHPVLSRPVLTCSPQF